MGLLGIGAASLLFWVLVIGAVLYLLRGRGGIRMFGPVLVLRRFDVQEAPRDGVFIRIIGRPAGLVGWLLTVLRLSEDTTLEVTRERILSRSASLRGQVHDLVPLPSVASTNCGYVKPLWCLFVAGAIFLLGIMSTLGSLGNLFGRGGVAEAFGGVAGALVGAAILGGIFLVIYWLQRKLCLSVRTRGGNDIGVVFKPSVIENVSIDLNRALQAISLINRKVLEAQTPPSVAAVPETSTHAAPFPARPTAAAPSPPRPAVLRCPQCGASLAPDERFCGNCGASAS
jgi:hypothetical protein